jgi:hypothetical protein
MLSKAYLAARMCPLYGKGSGRCGLLVGDECESAGVCESIKEVFTCDFSSFFCSFVDFLGGIRASTKFLVRADLGDDAGEVVVLDSSSFLTERFCGRGKDQRT